MPKKIIYRRCRGSDLDVRLHKKKNKTISHAKGFGLQGVMAGLSLFAMVAIYVSTINASAIRGAQVFELDKEIAALKQQQEDLRIKEAQLRVKLQSSDHISEHNMKPIEIGQYIVIEDESTIAIEY